MNNHYPISLTYHPSQGIHAVPCRDQSIKMRTRPSSIEDCSFVSEGESKRKLQMSASRRRRRAIAMRSHCARCLNQKEAEGARAEEGYDDAATPKEMPECTVGKTAFRVRCGCVLLRNARSFSGQYCELRGGVSVGRSCQVS